MSPSNTRASQTLLLALLFSFAVCFTAARAQQAPKDKAAGQPEDVIRVKTELVQTDLMVFDKRGRFVDGLRPEQFELSLDGKPRPIRFFERVSAGSAREAAQVRAEGGVAAANGASGGSSPSATGQGRVIFFFLDDTHLSESSIMRARRALEDFIENRMGPDDRVAIVSASGQIGFLQQLTDYKPVLREAVARLNYKRKTEAYTGKVPISEYQAIQVVDHNDRDLFVYLLFATINEYQSKGPLRRVAANIVRNRVRQISTEAKAATNDLLGVLESLVDSSAQLPGRKLVIFISDGFMADPRGSNGMTLLKRVTEMAARAGVVVYAMDARGTFGDPSVDAGRNDFPDGLATGTQAKAPSLEASAMQQALHILAEDTGGRAIINNNSFADAFEQAVGETSEYYLLAWQPEAEEGGGGKARIKVTVKDRPDLRVRLRRNYYVPPATAKQAASEKGANAAKGDSPGAAETPMPEAELLTALGATYPERTIPTALSVGYVSTPDEGLVLKASMQIDRSAVDTDAEGKGKAVLDVIGAAVDDRGLIVTFKQVLNVAHDASAAAGQPQPVVWNQQLKLKPGLYQVRVAVRERGSGRTGSAQQWIEVPDVSDGRFRMSSLFFGERRAAREENASAGPRAVTVDVDHRFSRSSVLRFQTYVYNAASAAAAAPPNVEIRARVLRGGKALLTTAPAKLPTDTTRDLSRLPYWAEMSLEQLPPGRYVLEVTATDRASNVSTSQQTGFSVE